LDSTRPKKCLSEDTMPVPKALPILNCRRLPALLNTAETAIFLGFQEHDIAPLVAAKLLTPLGKPPPNAPKYFAAIEVKAFTENREWLDRSTKAITSHWKRKNAVKAGREAPSSKRGVTI